MVKMISLFVSLCFIVFTGCTSDTNPLTDNYKLKFNDSVPFDKLSKGIVSFERIGPEGLASGVCLINIRNNTKSALNGSFTGSAISPDGNYIAFSAFDLSRTDYSVEIFTMNIEGRNLKNASNIHERATYPSWTPDSKNIFCLLSYPSFLGIYSFSIDNSHNSDTLYKSQNYDFYSPISVFSEKNMVFSELRSVKLFDNETKILTTLYTSPSIIYTPCWSPNGEKIAFAHEKFSEGFDNVLKSVGGIIQIYDMETKEVKIIYEWDEESSSRWAGQNIFSVCWSPEGDKLLFNKTENGNESHIFLINIDGTELTQITNEAGVDDRSVSWSRD